MLTAILLVTTPLTQCLWTWDHFLRGGQDYESTMLLVLAFICLALVLAQHCKKYVEALLLAAWHQSSYLSSHLLLTRIALVGTTSNFLLECGSSPGSEMYGLPLQI